MATAGGTDVTRVMRPSRLPRWPRLSWVSASTVIDPAHVEAAARLRTVFQQPRAAGEDPLQRDLADYDRAFGVTIDEAVA